MTRTGLGRALLACVLVVAGCGADPAPTPSPSLAGGSPSAATSPEPSAVPGGSQGPVATPAPLPGHELYGYLPYWEMDDPGIDEHLASLPLTTLALFSVTHRPNGTLNTRATGYGPVTGDRGRRFIADAHARGVRTELVYTSFGAARNRRLLEDPALQAKVIPALVALAGDLGVDGINVDIEALDPLLIPAYGVFVTNLGAALRAANPGATLSAATGAHSLGAAMAVAAVGAGVDRVFLMGYDYRTGRSQPGATAPLDRHDGESPSLRSSLDLYSTLGVPADRLLLGLPLYGVDWPVAGPVIGAPSTGRGEAWFPRAHVELLTDPTIVPERDEVEQVDVYFLGPDGTVGAPSAVPSALPSASAPASSAAPDEARTWRAVYVDTPGTLAPKLGLANERGLAGAGFWAVGYTRGLPEYTRLMEAFTRGDPLR